MPRRNNMPAPKLEKGQMSSVLKHLLAYVKKYRWVVLCATILAAGGSAISVIGPNKIQDMTNLITEGVRGTLDMTGIAHIGILLCILYGLGAIFTYSQGVMMSIITQRVTQTLRTDIDHKMNTLPLIYYDRTSFGDVLSRMTNDVDVVGQTLNQSMSTLLNAGTLFIGSIIMMFYTNWIMALSGIIAVLAGFSLTRVIIHFSQRFFIAQQRNLGRLNGHVEEVYSGHQVMKAFNGEQEATATFDQLNDALFSSAWKSAFLSGLMQPLMRFVGNLGYVIVSIVGAYLCFNGHIKFGVIVAFMMYIRMFTQPISQLAQVLNALQQTAAAGGRVFEFLGEQEMADESQLSTHVDHKDGAVRFDHVKFGYLPEKTIIHDFSLDVKPGEQVAIVGPTGAGKTTLVNLLMKFYQVDAGEIYIDEQPISQMTREWVHDQFCMVLQDTWLFEGTVKENIVYNQQGITDEQVVAACQAVGVDHFIQTLPNGYDTVLTDANNLSQGQRQLITIARAVIKDAPLLILDEATSSVDTRTELMVQSAMDHLAQNRTSFIIAHRLSTIKNADRIIVVRDGDIVESGNHEELLAQNGFYAELYNSQFED